MNEEIRQILLSQVLKKKAMRDQRRLPRPSNQDVLRLALALRPEEWQSQMHCKENGKEHGVFA